MVFFNVLMKVYEDDEEERRKKKKKRKKDFEIVFIFSFF